LNVATTVVIYIYIWLSVPVHSMASIVIYDMTY